jgi:hypothetical protein
MPILSNAWVAGGCWLAAAYVLGFLLRLRSIGFLNWLTWRRWSTLLQSETKELEKVFESAVANPTLIASLKSIAGLCGHRDPIRCAPYFYFAKRVVRSYPELWTEAERLEAEVRFAAGLFLPFLVLAFDALLRGLTTTGAWVLLAIGVGGATVVLTAFPPLRIKEIIYVHYLALVVLLYPKQRPPHPTAETS